MIKSKLTKKVWSLTDGDSEAEITLDLLTGEYGIWCRHVRTDEFMDRVHDVAFNLKLAHGFAPKHRVPEWLDPDVLYSSVKMYMMGWKDEAREYLLSGIDGDANGKYSIIDATSLLETVSFLTSKYLLL